MFCDLVTLKVDVGGVVDTRSVDDSDEILVKVIDSFFDRLVGVVFGLLDDEFFDRVMDEFLDKVAVGCVSDLDELI